MSEYWIIDRHTVVAADGDIGDFNHEAHCWQHLLSEFCDDIQNSDGLLEGLVGEISRWVQDDGGDPTALRGAILDHANTLYEQGRLPDYLNDEPYEWVRNLIGWDKEKFTHLLDNGTSDIRLYFCKNRGWIRIAGTACELWQVTPESLAVLADGLWEIFDESARSKKFLIDPQSTPTRHYSDVPYDVIERANPRDLLEYRNR